ncbi:MAG: CaiB/BaiF CoA-transferase family protein [Gammaproteobacteria bacterium]|nr:CaiB/BaiF CoA-transferase family protein [Gammaproteobacteria bacterium]MDE0225346.1 CaiB/BaiF CoA-transferase family protein [Gammaproteobacteria bacterium]MDE0450155.1 CaiB/BaiF CoA-transferase family protein [Gammaproteobacteria bacterium]
MGPLAGFRVIELAGIGPGPFCGMMLSDMGAEVIRVDRPGPGRRSYRSTHPPTEKSPGPPYASAVGEAPPAEGSRPRDVLTRNRRSIVIDLKTPEGVDIVLRLCESADALFEGFRPGVTERLGLGPNECMARNERLVYGRMTGWGQDGPLALAAGHDINYIGLAGVLHAIGEKGGSPVPPLNLIGDFGGGGMLLAFGLVCGILEASRSGKGQVIDAAMVDGSAALMAAFFSMGKHFTDRRGTNLLDGGAHFYGTYETRDGKHVSVGAIEPQFYSLLVEKADVDPDRFAKQMDAGGWEGLKEELGAIFKTRTRDEWCEIMEGTDVCFAPVLSIFEAPEHPHNRDRATFVDVDGVVQPAPAPRFSRTDAEISHGPRMPGEDTLAVLRDAGFSDGELEALQRKHVVSAA